MSLHLSKSQKTELTLTPQEKEKEEDSKLREEAKTTPQLPNPEIFLKGNTLRAYLYFLKRGDQEVGIREMQKALGFKTASLAQYHVQRLLEMGFITKTSFGNYLLAKETKLEILSPFVKFGSKVVPRLLMYLVMNLVLLIYSVAFILPTGSIDSLRLWVMILIGANTVALAYETIRSWKHIPF
jgi:hypothetical protein